MKRTQSGSAAGIVGAVAGKAKKGARDEAQRLREAASRTKAERKDG